MLLAVLAGCGEPPPDGMVALPAGTFTMGHDGAERFDEKPAHLVTLSAFAMDETLVTVAAFRTWVEQSAYVTSAERLGYAMVAVEGMKDWKWEAVQGANWRQPWGPAHADLAQGDDHPVTSVSWIDANAYCLAHDKRLPTEAEWDYAMRAGSNARYPWGDSTRWPDGTFGLNNWQGINHARNLATDGWRYTSPVRAYPPNAWGLYDAVGNVWQFTADWYGADTFATDAAGVVNPTGPATGWARVARGGSWWCSDSTCGAFGLWDRGKQHPMAPYPNNGFRCVRGGDAGGGA